jgi:hypothetical protein
VAGFPLNVMMMAISFKHPGRPAMNVLSFSQSMYSDEHCSRTFARSNQVI